jgi:hypothetical protein
MAFVRCEHGRAFNCLVCREKFQRQADERLVREVLGINLGVKDPETKDRT